MAFQIDRAMEVIMKVKDPRMTIKVSKGIKKWMVQLKRIIKTIMTIKMVKQKRIRTLKTQFFEYQPRQQKMHKSIENTRYVDQTKMYAKNNQHNVTADKDNLVYIDSAGDVVGIVGDAWVVEEVIKRTSKI